MARGLSTLTGRVWLLAAMMSLVTLVVAVGVYFAFAFYEPYEMHSIEQRMPSSARAELAGHIRDGRTNDPRYYELVEQAWGDQINQGDMIAIAMFVLLPAGINAYMLLVFARRVSKPITAVTRAAVRVQAGGRSIRVEESAASGETRDLVDSFNAMAAAIEAYERERMILTAGVAHELRTPLTILKGRLHGIIDGVIDPCDAADDPIGGEAPRLLRQVEQLSRIVEDLRTVAHADAGELELDLRPIDLGEVARFAVMDLTLLAKATDVRIAEIREPVKVRGDAVRLTQVLVNLLTNAIKHSPSQGQLRVVTQHEGQWATVRVEDEGPGFRPEDRENMFVMFWRAPRGEKAERRPGSGLGLALAAKLAEAHGGTILAENRADRSGAHFTLRLPSA